MTVRCWMIRCVIGGAILMTVTRVSAGQAVRWSASGTPNALFGASVARMGDKNGDGVPELLVTAPYDSAGPGLFEAGKVFAFSGTDGALLLEIVGPSQSATMGWNVVDAGDITGDGVPDVLVGSMGGGARLYSGSGGGLVSAWSLGYTRVGAPGDQDGDGAPEVLLGVPTTFGYSGSAYLYQSAGGTPIFSLAGTSSFGAFGGNVTGLADLDGDEVREYAVAAMGYSLMFSAPPGHVYVYRGGTADLIGELQGPQLASDFFGVGITSLEDVTGDGVPDVAASSGLSPGGPPHFGHVRVFSGFDLSLVTSISGIVASEFFGSSVADAGDVDGDGVTDLIVGAWKSPPFVPNVGWAGRAALHSGLTGEMIWDLHPPTGELLGMGNSVDGFGDVDGDDFPEFVVGASGPIYPFPPGIVRLYSGAPIGIVAYASGCAPSGAMLPRIGASKSAKVGTTSSVNLSRTAPGRPALLLLGFSSVAWWGIPLPLDLGFLGMPGCDLLISPDLPIAFSTTAFGPGNGRAVAPIAIPADPVLAGGQFYAQWFVAGPGPGLFPGSMTRGLAITVQP